MIKIFFRALIVLFAFFALNGATTNTKGTKVQPIGGCATTTASKQRVCIPESDRTKAQKSNCKFLKAFGIVCKLDLDCLITQKEDAEGKVRDQAECSALAANHTIVKNTSLLKEAREGSKEIVSLKKGDKVTLLSRLDQEGLSGWYLIFTKNCETGFVPEKFIKVAESFGEGKEDIVGNIKINYPKWKQKNQLMEIDAEGFVSLTGTINEKTVDKVTINGEEVYIESNNTFLEMLDVPMSGLEVRVVASNEGTKVESIKFKIKVK